MDNPLSGLECYQNKLDARKGKLGFSQTNQPAEVNPIVVEDSLAPVPPFPVEMLPVALQPWVKDVTFRKQCPSEYVAIPAMVMIASLIGKGCHIKPLTRDDWRVVPNLWGGIVGDPGTLKTPACQEALFPLKALEKDAFEAHGKEMEGYREKAEQYSSQKERLDFQKKKAIRKDDKEALETITAEYKALKATEPELPLLRRYKVGDVTFEKLQELLARTPRGLLLFRDELTGFLTSLEKKGHETDRSFYLEAWDGQTDYPLERVTRGTIIAREICLSLLGTVQPEKLLAYLKKNMNNLANDGFMQRFQLLVYPDRKPWQLVEKSPDLFAQDRIRSLCRRIVSMDFLAYGAIQDAPRYEGEESKPYFRFSPEGQLFFNTWIQKHQRDKLEGNDAGVIVEHLSKYRSLMPSLALVDHIIDISDRQKNLGQVSLESAQKAAEWCEFLEAHARRIYGLVLDGGLKSDIPPSKADALLVWMRKQSRNDDKPLSRRFILRNSRLRSSKELDPVLSDLMDMGYIEPVNGNAFRILSPDNLTPAEKKEGTL